MASLRVSLTFGTSSVTDLDTKAEISNVYDSVQAGEIKPLHKGLEGYGFCRRGVKKKNNLNKHLSTSALICPFTLKATYLYTQNRDSYA